MPFTPKTILLAGAIGAMAMFGAVEAQAGHLYMPFGGALNPDLDPTEPTIVYPLADEALDAVDDVHDAAEDAAAAAAAAAVTAAALAHDALDE